MLRRGSLLAALLVPCLLVGGAQAGEPTPRVAVLWVKLNKTSSSAKSQFEEAVVEGLKKSGVDVMSVRETGKRLAGKSGLAGCETPDCFATMKELTGASHLVRGWVDVLGSTYNIKLEMVDATSVRVDVESNRCETCSQREAAETASLSASALKVKVFGRAQPVAAVASLPSGPSESASHPETPAATTAMTSPSGPPPVASDPMLGAPPVVLTAPPLYPPPAPPSQVVPWIAVGTGAAAMAGGIALLVFDGDPTCSVNRPGQQCKDVRDTAKMGVAIIGVGALAAGFGIYGLATAPGGAERVAVSVGPAGVSARGRF